MKTDDPAIQFDSQWDTPGMVRPPILAMMRRIRTRLLKRARDVAWTILDLHTEFKPLD